MAGTCRGAAGGRAALRPLAAGAAAAADASALAPRVGAEQERVLAKKAKGRPEVASPEEAQPGLELSQP